jgi:hypothetical protein
MSQAAHPSYLVLLSALLFLPVSVAAEGGVLYVSPERAEHTIGDVFDVQVLVDSGGTAINAAEAEITFNPAAVAVENLSTDNSLLEVWPTLPVFSNEDGYVRFSGLMRSTYSGDHGHLLTITFRALRNMSSNARFAAGAVLAADGIGSNIITSMKSGAFTIQPKEIPIPVDPDTLDVEAPLKPQTPQLTEYDSRVKVGNHIVVKGICDPNIKVAMYMAYGNEGATRVDLMSAADGSFVFVSNGGAKMGAYHIYATAVSDGGIVSDRSNMIDITAESVGFAAAATFGLSVTYQLIPFVALLVVAGLGGGYLLHRHKVAKPK